MPSFSAARRCRRRCSADSRGRGARDVPTFVSLNAAFAAQLNAQELGDAAPTPGALAAYAKACGDLRSAAAAWTRLRASALADLDAESARRARAAVEATAPALAAAAASPCR